MTLPASGPITLNAIETEFGGVDQPLSAFVRGGLYVPDTTANAKIPKAEPIKLTDFYKGTAAPAVPNTVLNKKTVAPFITLHQTGLTAVAHSEVQSTVQNVNERFVVDMIVKCGPGQIDSAQMLPHRSGYLWAKERMQILVGVDASSLNMLFEGISIDMYLTDSAKGYFGCRALRITDSGNVSYSAPPRNNYFQGPGSEYFNDVLPNTTPTGYIKLRVSRGASVVSFTSNGIKYALTYQVTMFRRPTWAAVWNQVWNINVPEVLSSFNNARPYNAGGAIVIGNSNYPGGGVCNLSFSSIKPVLGVTVPPAEDE